MERKIDLYFQKWKKDVIRKPLILYGAKQIGKTYSVLSFGKKEYKNTVYINSQNNKELKEIFQKERSTEKLILRLSTLSGETILKEDTLIVIDNVNDLDIIKGLKIFGSEHSKYHIITIITTKDKLSEFKGEELQFKAMYSLDFEEYLWAKDETSLANLIKESFEKRKTNPFHKVALELFEEYLTTGGLPEVIEASLNEKDEYELDAIKQKIINVYKNEVSLNNVLIDIPSVVWVNFNF